MGLSLFRGEIGPRPRTVAAARPAPGVEASSGPSPDPTPPTDAGGLSDQLRRVAQFMGPAGLMMAGMLVVLIFGSMLISWLG